MLLSRVEDPRDLLEKATRYELWQFAKARGVKQIDPSMGAILMRRILRNVGQTDIVTVFPHLRQRSLGQMNGVNSRRNVPQTTAEPVKEIDASDDLMRQWMEQRAQAEQPQPLKAKPLNEFQALRAECKKRGIKLARTDRLADLKAKLHGKDATAGG